MSGSAAWCTRGILNLDKPAGITSRQAVNQLQARCGKARVGHAGTLDPLATGVLLMGIGQGTRLISDLQRLPKTYQATFLLGHSSETEDIEGEVVRHPAAREPGRNELEAAAQQFVGRIAQRPPRFSALKVSGRRAYDLARAGQTFELSERWVDVYRIKLLRYEYPELELEIDCGSGTYVRSLGRDLASACGTHAVMSQLRRLAIGPFEVGHAVAWDALIDQRFDLSFAVQPIELAVAGRPREILSEPDLIRVQQGQAVAIETQSDASSLFAFDASGRLRAEIGQRPTGLWHPLRVFPLTESAAAKSTDTASRNHAT
jgi:tRNA pseudouridine55 synthase